MTTSQSSTAGYGVESQTARGRGDYARAVNVGNRERWASVIGGGLLALYGLARGRLGGLALAGIGAGLVSRGLTGHCPAYQALGIRRTPDGAVLGNLENLPRFMSHIVSIETIGDRRSHWRVRAPGGVTLEWDAEIINEKPNELIAWRSVQKADVDHAGSVRFEPTPDGRGTIVHVSLQYDPPGGVIGHEIAAFLGADAPRQIEEDLDNLKKAVESWEASTDRSPASGRHVA